MAGLKFTCGQLVVSHMLDTVTVEIKYGDNYEAINAYDEMIARLREGHGLTLGFEQPAPTPPR
jgi:hypothetical protein